MPSDLLHLLSDDLPIFDELCRRSLKFINKCFFHSSSLVRFVTRHGVTVKLRIEAGPRIDAGPRIQAGGLIHLYR